jgi:hypothetical protein
MPMTTRREYVVEIDVDAVAEAICNADNTCASWSQFVESYGIDCFACKRFRRMAQAAIDAIFEPIGEK